MAMVEGIDKLGQSLLSQSASKRKQLRDDVKKYERRERNAQLIGGALRFVDGIVRDRHADWANGEANRNATRFINKQKKWKADRKQYEDEWQNSGLSAEEYEVSLLEKSLTDNKLNNLVPDWLDLNKNKKRDILYGAGVAYDPKTDNYLESGLYKALAHKNVAARNAWAERLKDLDPVEAQQEWDKVNPRSRNLFHGAFKLIQKTGLFNSPNSAAQMTEAQQLANLQKETGDFERFYKMRAAGFSTSGAIEKLNDEEGLITKEDLVGEWQKTEYVDKTIKSPAIFQGRKIVREQTITQRRDTYKSRGTGKVISILSPLNSKDTNNTNPTTGEKFTKEEIEKSKVGGNYQPTSYTVSSTDPLTGGDLSYDVQVFFDEAGDPYDSVVTFKDVAAVEIAADPTLAHIKKDIKLQAYDDFELVFPTLVAMPGVKDIGSPKDYLDKYGGVTPHTSAKQYERVILNVGGKLALTKLNIKDIIEDQLGFSSTVTSQVAAQLGFIDKYAQNLQLGLGGRTTFKGLSSESVDPAKLLLALDLLRSAGNLSTDASGNLITSNSLKRKIENSDFFNNNSFKGNPNIEGEQYFDDAELLTIKGIKSLIDQHDGASRDFGKNTLLDIPVGYIDALKIDPLATHPEEEFKTAYELMIGEIGESSEDQKLTTSEAADYLKDIAINVAGFFTGDTPDQAITDDSLLDAKTTGFTLSKVNKFLQKDLYPAGHEPSTPEEIKVAGVGSQATRDFRVSRFRALAPLIPDAQARHDVIDNASRFLEAFETEEGAVNQIQLLKEKINLLDTTDMTLGAVNRRVEGIDIGILGISEDTARKIAGIDTTNVSKSFKSSDPSLLNPTTKKDNEVNKLLTHPVVDGLNNLVTTAITDTGSTNTDLGFISGIIDIETEKFPDIAGKTTADSGHDAHGMMQIKTSTAVQPGFNLPTIFDVADKYNISYDKALAKKARNQMEANYIANKPIESVKGKAGKQVVSLLQDPKLNVAFGVTLLNYYLDIYKGDKELAALGFNQGKDISDAYAKDPSYKIPSEGVGYIEKAKKRGLFN